MDSQGPLHVSFLVFVIVVTILAVALGVTLFPHR